jgi:organic hydroperoxide reductase OsmC/OhrA
MAVQHHYQLTVKWTGNKGTGTSDYRGYERSHSILADGKPEIAGSSDPAFRGDKSRYNPEELLLASLASCHMLWFLHLCTEAGVVVADYTDQATGIMQETADGGGYFSEVILYPNVFVTDENMVEKASQLHKKANKLCFIANSVNFAVHHEPTCQVKE